MSAFCKVKKQMYAQNQAIKNNQVYKFSNWKFVENNNYEIEWFGSVWFAQRVYNNSFSFSSFLSLSLRPSLYTFMCN